MFTPSNRHLLADNEDAAFVFDQSLTLLKGANLKSPTVETNFRNNKENRRVRAEEMRRTCLDVDFGSVRPLMELKLEPVVKEVAKKGGSARKELDLDSDDDGGTPSRKKEKKKKEKKRKSPR